MVNSDFDHRKLSFEKLKFKVEISLNAMFSLLNRKQAKIFESERFKKMILECAYLRMYMNEHESKRKRVFLTFESGRRPDVSSKSFTRVF